MSQEFIRIRDRISRPQRTWHGRRIVVDSDDGKEPHHSHHIHYSHHHGHRGKHRSGRGSATGASHFARTVLSGSGVLTFIVWAVKQFGVSVETAQQGMDVLAATGIGNDIAEQTLKGGNLANQLLLLTLCSTNSVSRFHSPLSVRLDRC